VRARRAGREVICRLIIAKVHHDRVDDFVALVPA
jgi:hypothetical protein